MLVIIYIIFNYIIYFIILIQSGRTPLDLARKRRNHEVIEVLERQQRK